MTKLFRLTALVSLAGLAGCVGAPAPGPVAYAPGGPVVAPPPGYAAPGYAPAGYAPAAPYAAETAAPAYGGRCYAGVYTCALPQALPVGAPCSCPGLGAPSYGNVR